MLCCFRFHLAVARYHLLYLFHLHTKKRRGAQGGRKATRELDLQAHILRPVGIRLNTIMNMDAAQRYPLLLANDALSKPSKAPSDHMISIGNTLNNRDLPLYCNISLLLKNPRHHLAFSLIR